MIVLILCLFFKKKLTNLIEYIKIYGSPVTHKCKRIRGTNFRGIDLLVLLRDIFVQVLIFMYFTPTVIVTGISLINATPSVMWRLLERDV